MSSEPVRIGTIDLDTSHAAVFAQLLHGGDRCRIAAVWDSGDIHPPGYAQQFADEHQIAQVCQNYEEITELVDAVMIHGVRWETHID
ncbi:MAG: oxidoreductase, partial [Candidatus Latescibacteria bacterium]|nr:oxidoreductase [Candidatus Latescibacterota bacterium]